MKVVYLETEKKKKKERLEWAAIIVWIVDSSVEHNFFLTAWEKDFLAKLAANFTSNTFKMSPKQEDLLLGLYGKLLRFIEWKQRLQ
jgi:hypothetical protein